MNLPDWTLSVSDRIYRFLLRAYPAEFRDKYETPMAQVFRDRCREELNQRRALGLVASWMHSLFDLALTAAVEHMDTLFQDLRYGSRVLLASPGFTTLAVIALALGIGANSAIFSAMTAALLPLPYKEPERLVVLSEPWASISKVHFAVWKEQNRVFEQMAAFSWEGANLTDGRNPEYVIRGRVSANFFSLLGTNAQLGRTFLPEEEQQGADEVVISHDLWQHRYHSDPKLLGKSLTLNGENFKVVGMMPPDFYPPGNESVELWTALDLKALDAGEPAKTGLVAMARLKPGVTLEAAKSDMARISPGFEHKTQGDITNRGSLAPLESQHSQYMGPTLTILQVSVAFMLLLACANVGGLLLARAATRQKEMSIRTTLGASRPRLIRQLLTESLLLALLGGALGLLLALGIAHLLSTALAAANSEFPWFSSGLNEIGVNSRLLGFTLLTTLLTGLIMGLIPALRGSKTDLKESLQGGGWKWTTTFRRQHLHSWLVVFEVAIALVLLTRATLEVQKFFETPEEFRPGLNPSHVLTMEVRLPEKQYRQDDQIVSVYQQILQRIEALPGVQSVAMIGRAPWFDNSNPILSWLNDVGIAREPKSSSGSARGLSTSLGPVTPSFLRTMRIPLRKGRYFTEEDSRELMPPAIISEGLDQILFPGEDPIGKTVRIVDLPDDLKFIQPSPLELDRRKQKITELPGAQYSIKGVAQNLGNELFNQGIYVPYTRAPESAQQSMRFMNLVVRTSSDPTTLADKVCNAVWAVDKDLPVSRIRTLEQRLKGWAAPERLLNQLLGFFAVAALMLAAVGIFGLMTYIVTQRTHEIGVRLSLGAHSSQMLRLVMTQGIKLILMGVVLGLVFAFTLPIFLPILYEIITLNPRTFSGDLAPQRVMILLFGILGVTALVLAASGIYSLRQESPSAPKRLSGLLTATRAIKQLVGRASKVTLTGVVGGLYLASGLVGVFASLEGARMTHPPTFIGASLLLTVVALLACYLTARKATRIDPLEAFQAE